MRSSESLKVEVDRQEPFSWIPYPNFGCREDPAEAHEAFQWHSYRDILLSSIDLLPRACIHRHGLHSTVIPAIGRDT